MKRIPLLFAKLILVLTANAQITFEKVYSDSGNNFGNCLALSPDGGYVITGRTNTTGLSDLDDACLFKIDSMGNMAWGEKFNINKHDEGLSLTSTSDGGYVIAGYSDTMISPSSGKYLGLLIKTDENGNLIWTRTYNFSSSAIFFSVKQTSDKGFIITGDEALELLLMKTDSMGNIMWKKNFTSSCSYYYGRSVIQTSTNH